MQRLFLLGLFALITSTQADVKHVLDGSAHPPPCYQGHQHYHHTSNNNLASASASANTVVPGSVAFWWADSDSPFKQAYEYFKKCSSKTNCIPPIAPSFQAPNNALVPNSAPVPNSEPVSNNLHYNEANLDKNPFLNGQIQGVSQTTPKIDLSRNPFLNTGMQAAYSSTGQAVTTGSEGFLGVQPAVPFSSGVKTQPFAASYPNADNQQKPSFSSQHPSHNGQPFANNHPSCVGGEIVCVLANSCVNGVVNVNQRDCVKKQADNQCEVGKEECCRLFADASYTTSSSFASSFAASHSSFSNLSHFANGKSSSDSVIKFSGGAGLSPGSIQIVSDNQPIPNPLLVPGVKGGPSNKIKVIRNTLNNNSAKPVFASTIDYTDDKFDDLSFDAAFQGPQYLPPLDGTRPPISYTPELLPPVSSYQPSFPTTSRPQPTPQHTPFPSSTPFKPQSPSTFRPQFTQSVGSGSSFVSSIASSRPTASNEYLPPYSTPKPPVVHIPTGSNVNNQYVIPTITNTPPQVIYPRPTVPSTPKPFISSPRPTPGYQYPEPSPPFVYPKPSTSKPIISGNSNINNQYISRPTPGYSYPTPTPTFGYPTVSRIPSQPTFNYPKPTTFKPFLPSQPITYRPKPSVTVSNAITHPVKNGYSYPTPHPPFTYAPQPSNVGEVFHPRPSVPTSNQYLPPRTTTEPNLEAGASGTGPVIRPPPRKPQPPNTGSPNEPIGNVVSPYGGCAAALKCVQEIYCTAEGMISPTPVVLTPDQAFLRAPTTDCFDRQAGIVGKCCRDPFYVDPWPSANLINGVDDGQYREDPRLGQYFAQKQRPSRSGLTLNAPSVEQCGVRNPNIAPKGQGPIDVNFAEIPWQAMVLRDTNRSLLCAGAIIKPNAVLTAAHCVEGLETRDVLVKGGEWKLGIDEEPLPFQIIRVAAIIRHPSYTAGSLKNDLALLMLEENFRTAKNIAPICLPPANQRISGQCIATGWGKRILQLHLRGAIMRSIDINIIDSNTCTQKLQNKYQHVLPDFSESIICADSKNDHCDVDYGSALACTNGNGQYTLSGIFSWETGCKDKDQIGGYIPPDMEWIETTCAKPLKDLKILDKQYNQ